MELTVEFKPNLKTEEGLKKIPDMVLYSVARQVLDMSYDHIPRDTNKLRTSSISRGIKGVEGGEGDYYIGSYTDYASYVWKMPDSTQWTEPNTNGEWYLRTMKEQGEIIVNNAVSRAWKETM